MTRLVAALSALVILAGCAGVPFREHQRVPMRGLDPAEVARAYQAVQPGEFNLLSSIMFRYNFFSKITVLGTIEADAETRRFSVVGISPLGVKLFELRADESGITDKFLIKPMEDKGDLTEVVARDIRRIYYDNVPSAGAKVKVKKYSIEFREPYGDGRMVYIFAGPEARLVMKKYYEQGLALWKIGYYEYTTEDGRIYPGGVLLTDYQWGYTLTVRTRKIYAREN